MIPSIIIIIIISNNNDIILILAELQLYFSQDVY